MHASLPYAQTRLCSEPVAEVCGFVASNKPTRLAAAQSSCRMAAAMGGPNKQLAHVSPLRRSPSLLGRSHYPEDAAVEKQQYGRALEILRTLLASATIATDSSEKTKEADAEPAVRWDLELAQKRAAFVEALQELQHPHADIIEAINVLLVNRAGLGLLTAAAANDYVADTGDDDMELTLTIVNSSGSPVNSMSSSLDSEESTETLANGETRDDEMLDEAELVIDDDLDAEGQPDKGSESSFIEAWASGELWSGAPNRRSASICSDSTLNAAGEALRLQNNNMAEDTAPTPVPDDMGICWPLDDLSSPSARSWGRFYAELGEVRIPTRFRVPQNSLFMLATEQLMMRNDKIVCPLKNRLQEANPRRQCFEDYVRATGTVPPSPSTVKPLSPLRSEVDAA
ncbi:hypothetical protein COEREDRAFT_82069 [Coemansia reversa NRRL 1564]|uniref:Uncharacterized protein n=1 Tax=Coemansia reversa (strain ATCC 12441 / NRRL 1564) TaxID=763665 RepID=A0A2G5B8I4_COERN|nr:hypothetical protein COEREDRAFT_82069 [Coemansia reversa NRRL 1564]|eukprot:PIA15311.1 hypothetical protein COEREDRAFT_82069 [Coemansia reversa NRRL 1564]